jgi:hypothetical protein
MRYLFRDSRVANAAFNSFRATAGRLGLSPRAERVIGITLSTTAILVIGCGTYLGALSTSMCITLVLASLCSLLTRSHRHLAPYGLALALALGLSGCSPDARPDDRAGSALAGSATTQGDLRTSIREATRYRDPREGLNPKGINLLDGEAQDTNGKDANHEAH